MLTKLDYYKIFYETACRESFSLTARDLYISQSAISQCIHQLEQDLNTQLFIRSRRGVKLTKEGHLLFQKVEAAIKSIEQGEALISKLHHLDGGSLILAAGDSITKHYLLPYLEKFHKLYPNIRIEMANSYSHQMLKLVKDGTADLAFVNLPVFDEELSIKECFKINDIFVCGPETEIKPQYSWQEIAELPLILLENNSTSRKYLNTKFSEKNIDLMPQIEIAAHDLLIQFASIHLGVSCVVEEFSKEGLDKGVVRKLNIQPPIPQRSIGYAHLKNSPLSVAAQAFLDLIEHK